MSDEETVLYQPDGSIARITLNRPEKRNALNDRLIDQLKTFLRQAHHDPDIRVIVLSGAGSDFCAGADLAALQKISTASIGENLEDAQSLMELFMLLRSVRQPVIAAVAGRALAGGCGLALGCDLVIAADSAQFGFPEVKLGFVPAMVMAVLRRNVSEKKAFELIATGNAISAAEASALGLINKVVAASELQSTAESNARSLTKISPSALSLSKSLLYQTDALPFPEALAAGVDVNVTARLTEECQKGVARFLARE